jgi:hypothetical protein
MRNSKIVKITLIVLLAITILYLLFASFRNIEKLTGNKKTAITVLTRGYDSNDGYAKLIQRNKQIVSVFYNLLDNKDDYDVIIFHEGNITQEQQKYIQSNTPEMPMQFNAVEFLIKNVNNPYCPNNEVSNAFGLGYKNMCYFWSISFLEYLKNYEYIIRIDEDCFLESLEPNLILNYRNNNVMFSSARYQDNDDKEVIVGLQKLFDDYLSKTGKTKKNELTMPYTNFMVVNIPFFRENVDVINILAEIKNSDCIFSNRWGDLPIWGYILSYFIDRPLYIEDKTVVYNHESHGAKIN